MDQESTGFNSTEEEQAAQQFNSESSEQSENPQELQAKAQEIMANIVDRLGDAKLDSESMVTVCQTIQVLFEASSALSQKAAERAGDIETKMTSSTISDLETYRDQIFSIIARGEKETSDQSEFREKYS